MELLKVLFVPSMREFNERVKDVAEAELVICDGKVVKYAYDTMEKGCPAGTLPKWDEIDKIKGDK